MSRCPRSRSQPRGSSSATQTIPSAVASLGERSSAFAPIQSAPSVAQRGALPKGCLKRPCHKTTLAAILFSSVLAKGKSQALRDMAALPSEIVRREIGAFLRGDVHRLAAAGSSDLPQLPQLLGLQARLPSRRHRAVLSRVRLAARLPGAALPLRRRVRVLSAALRAAAEPDRPALAAAERGPCRRGQPGATLGRRKRSRPRGGAASEGSARGPRCSGASGAAPRGF